MRRVAAVVAGLCGVLLVPLGLSWETMWLMPLAHLTLCLLAAGLALQEGWRGRPGVARAWGAWVLVATAAGMAALDRAGWAEGHAMWWLPYLATLGWGWMPIAAAWGAGQAGEGRQRALARAAVRRRQRVAIRTAQAEAVSEG